MCVCAYDVVFLLSSVHGRGGGGWCQDAAAARNGWMGSMPAQTDQGREMDNSLECSVLKWIVTLELSQTDMF